MKGKLIFILVLLLLLAIFTAQNYEVVKVQFLFWSFKTSRAIIIFSSLILGFISGVIVTLIKKK